MFSIPPIQSVCRLPHHHGFAKLTVTTEQKPRQVVASLPSPPNLKERTQQSRQPTTSAKIPPCPADTIIIEDSDDEDRKQDSSSNLSTSPPPPFSPMSNTPQQQRPTGAPIRTPSPTRATQASHWPDRDRQGRPCRIIQVEGVHAGRLRKIISDSASPVSRQNYRENLITSWTERWKRAK